MPYALKFYLLLFVAEVAVFLVARWLSPFGLGVNLVFALAAAYLFQACAYLQRGNGSKVSVSMARAVLASQILSSKHPPADEVFAAK